ncbi:MAG: methyltransferase domain-containing protein [Verrucomicrobiaceae bacterium]|nr:methyltransferase domain-containing protein [Verrucomicrobiaceae bacterium]
MAAKFQDVDLYDYPDYYDVIFDDGTSEEADFLESIFTEYGRPKTERLLEPACGTGRLLIELAKRGYEAHGFDASEAMLKHGERRARGVVTLPYQRMESFQMKGKFDAAYSLISSFKYLLSESLALAHLQRIAACLKPGGLFILGLHLSDYDRKWPVHERWVVERGGQHVICNTRTWPADRKRRRERVRNRLRIESKGLSAKYHESSWEFRTYDARQLRRLLSKVPELAMVGAYDFGYDLSEIRELDDSQEDIVLVLRR